MSDNAEPTAPEQAERLISRQEMLARVRLSYPTVWHLMREDRFPRGRAVGARTFWLESEITAWIASQPVRRLKGDTDGVADAGNLSRLPKVRKVKLTPRRGGRP